MTTPAPGNKIGAYEIIGQIGTGGMATVYRARQPKLQRDVAIKLMHQAFLADKSFSARFEREAQIVGSLDHPNIVPIYDFDEFEGRPYLVMKYIEGQTLKDILSKGALPLDQILTVIPAVASALHFAHQRGVLHRDVKPSNIMIDTNGTPYLTDFGLARIAQAGESTMSTDMMLGTPHYISPEQAQGNPDLDSRTDVYSFGVVLYELVMGRVPYTGETPFIIVHKHIYNDPTPPSELDPNIPPAVEAVLLKALEKDPEKRYQTPVVLANAFREAVAQSRLTALDADRTSRAVAYRAVTPSPPPVYKQDADGQYVNIESALPKNQAQSAAPSRASNEQAARFFSQETLREVVERFREAAIDIRDQVRSRDFFERVRDETNRAIVEVRANLEELPATLSAIGDGSSTARRRRVILRDWGTDDNAIRHRLSERASRRNGLIAHVVVYLIASAILLSINNVIQAALSMELAETPEAGLANLNIALVVLLAWGSGLAAHALEVFSKTGRRLENRRRAIYDAMVRGYGDDWVETADDRAYKRVRSRVEKRLDRRVGLLQHGVISVFLTGAVLSIWQVLQPVIALEAGADRAFVESLNVPLIFAAIMAFTVLIHAISTVFASDAARSEYEREREFTMSAVQPKLKNDEGGGVRLTEDGELTTSFVEEMDELKRGKR